MALTFIFVGATPNRAVYKITSNSGGGGTIPNTGGATPDLLTDIPANTPLGAYLQQAVANDAAAANLLNYTTAAEIRAQCTTPDLQATTGFFAVLAKRSVTSGKSEIAVNSDADGAEGNIGGTLTIELFHTIAK